MLGTHAPHTKSCEVCARPFTPARMGQRVCGMTCARKVPKVLKAKERAETKARRRALETIPELKKEAQRWFNKFVRLRDREKGCYVCLRPFPVGRIGGDFDAGHVRSTGSADHLRYTEDNCFGECKQCNSSWGAKQHEKEAGAVRRIGVERWEAVRNDNATKHWTRDGLRELIAHYKAECKRLEAESA
jgi:hypothetical protein